MNWAGYWLSVFMLLWTVGLVKLLDNGLAKTPPMGWMSWGYYMCGVDCEKNPNKCLDENLIKSVANTFYNEGYQEAGYEYIVIDDCWAEKKRDKDGHLVPDKKRFPSGMKYLADYQLEPVGGAAVVIPPKNFRRYEVRQIHSRGLKFGMYTNIADITCMHYPGSKGHFAIDAKTFAMWGVDYIKVDGCFVGEEYLNTAYVKFGQYLNATGRPMVYSCSWPYYIEYIIHKKPNYTNIVPQCNMWRNYHDVVTSWEAVKAIILHYQQAYSELSKFHGPGHWNDPDMLIFGTNSLKDSQSRVHIAVYVMLSAPLLLSCDMKNMKEYEKELLLNMDLIAIGQDPLGVMAKPILNSVTLWVKPHLPRKGDVYHSVSFALVNLEATDAAVSFTPGHYGLNSTDGYTVMNVFTGTYVRNITLNDAIDIIVPAEDVILYSVYPL